MGVGASCPFPLILATIIIMADLKNHIFPLFLKGAPQSITANQGSTATWNGDTSLFVADGITAACTVTIPDSETPGTILTFRNLSSGGALTVSPTTDFYTNNDRDVFQLNEEEMCTMIWLDDKSGVAGTKGWSLLAKGDIAVTEA